MLAGDSGSQLLKHREEPGRPQEQVPRESRGGALLLLLFLLLLL